MQEIILELAEMAFNNIYELLLGAGIVLTTIFGRNKSAEKLVEIRQKTVAKKKKKLQKKVAAAEKLNEQIKELEKGVKNVSSSNEKTTN